ncbi:MAG: Mut7-C RNAse domain-containing protein [Deltaproteobacteria bacterium]|nr:Mut7-C RNAse domain-containing protein [Deltaproteobacteria bacterium]MBN2845258.1 Mut7-C RNAse domain-containing protein [Deltaproteobacteria bacterium]
MKFLADRNLGKLTKWLRVIGYDSEIYQGAIGREFLREGAKQGRIVLTRRRDMASRNFTGKMYVVNADTLPEQLAEVIKELSLQLNLNRFFSICLRCNQPLSEIEKAEVRDRVPPYVFQSQSSFLVCRRCNAIFWAGTHKENMVGYLKRHNLIHHL